MPRLTTARLTIDLDALANNLRVLRAAAGAAEVAAVVKADGYGLGVGPIGRRLRREGIRSFFIAHVAEGEALRAALGPEDDAAIYVLDGLTEGSGPRLLAAGLTPVLSTEAQAEAAMDLAAGLGRRLGVGLHVDTGMNRQGLTPAQAEAFARRAGRRQGLEIALVMSHLGCAATPGHPRNGAQLARFRQVRALFPEARASLAASAGVFLGGDYLFEMVRPGISLYGGGPLERPDPRFRAVATLEAPLIDVRDLAAGELVGYGDGVAIERPMRLGVVAAGYADGVIRSAKGAGYAWVDGARRRLVVVNMNMLAIDLTGSSAKVGDSIELLGDNALLDDLAAAAGSVAHEWLVRLSRRAERRYLGDGEPAIS